MVKGIRILGIAVIGLLVGYQTGMAREFADIYTDCGLGAMIAPRNPVVAAVTNVTWDLGTTAISSNISCPDACKGGQEKVASFIYESYDSLEKDLANGSGEYLDTLMELLKSDTQNNDRIVTSLRDGFKGIVSAPGYIEKTRYQKAESLYNLLYQKVGKIS